MAVKYASNSDPVEQKRVPRKAQKNNIWTRADINRSKVIFYTQCFASVVLVQLLFLMDTVWVQDVNYKLHTGLWLLFSNIALLFLNFNVGNKTEFFRNKIYAVTWSAILLQLGLIILWRHLMGLVEAPLGIDRVLFFPYIVAPLITAFLLGARLGAFVTVAVTMLGLGIVEPSVVMNYGVFSITTGMATVFIASKARKRSSFYRAGWVCGLVVVLLGLLLGCIPFVDMSNHLNVFLKSIGVAFAVSFGLSVLITGLLPGLENLFRITTPISWLEFADLNHDLLKKLQINAPGTYHHSTKVSLLAEAAAESIGANADFCRVAALYHDVGKIEEPEYFVENLADVKNSPHNELDPKSSAKIILDHVKKGGKLAQEYKLNREIQEAIQQHHGKSLVYVFYRKALDRYNELKEKKDRGEEVADDNEEVSEIDFQYPGPIPQSKEVAIISLADIVESATRSLLRPTEDQIKQMIDDLVAKRILDGHLDDSGLTLGDIQHIKASFLNSLKSMDHNRISYPKEDSSKEEKSKPTEPVAIPLPAEKPEVEVATESSDELKSEASKLEENDVSSETEESSSATPPGFPKPLVMPRSDGLSVEELSNRPIPGQKK